MSNQLDILKGNAQLRSEVLGKMQAPCKPNKNLFSSHRDIPVWKEGDPEGQAYYARCIEWDNHQHFRELIRHNLRSYLRSRDLSGLIEYKLEDLALTIAHRLAKEIRKQRRQIPEFYDRLNNKRYMRLWWALGAELIMAGADIKTTEGPMWTGRGSQAQRPSLRKQEYDDLEYKGRNRSWDEWGRQ